MCSTSLIPIWFVCKPCSINFQNLNDFIEHKNEEHLQELLQNKCIVFEERTLDGVAIAETGAAEADQGYDATHLVSVKEETLENTTNSDLCIENIRSEQIPNSQFIIKSESQINFNDPNDEPTTVNNILGLNLNSYFELDNLNQNPNDNFCEDVKPNPEDLINTNSEKKIQVYEIENGETQSVKIRKKPTPNSSVSPERLTQQQEIESASPVLVKVKAKYRRLRKMCSVCLKSFADQRRLNGHFERVHKPPLPLPDKSLVPQHLACKVCGRKYKKSAYLRRHFEAMHNSDLNQNSNDNFFEDVNPNPDDLINTNPETKYKAYETENGKTQSEDLCKIQTQNPSVSTESLSQQQEIQNASPVLVKVKAKYRRPRKMCSICPKSFVDRRSLRKHFERVHKLPFSLPLPKHSLVPKQLACKVCGNKFTAPSDLRRHCRAMHEIDGLDLEYRRQPAKFKSNAQACTICHNSYAGISSLKRHIQLKHGNNNKNDDELANVTIKKELN